VILLKLIKISHLAVDSTESL